MGRGIFVLSGKEIRSSFVTPLGYVVITGFLLLAGFFFFTILQQYNSFLAQAALMKNVSPNLNEWVVNPYYQTLEIILIFLVPILTMSSIAGERQHGTFELLLTSPVSTTSIVLGKFLGVSAVVVLMLLLSFVFPGVLLVFADPEIVPVFVGLVGVILFALAFVALGVAVSAFARSPIVAGVISLVVLLVFYIADAPAQHLGDRSAALLRYLAPATHTEPLIKGVLASGDVVYFISVTVVGLFIANRALDAQRWR